MPDVERLRVQLKEVVDGKRRLGRLPKRRHLGEVEADDVDAEEQEVLSIVRRDRFVDIEENDVPLNAPVYR